MPDPIAAIAQPETKSAKASSKLATDMDSFLLPLTTQLKHQDPLSPLDPTEFTGQLVAFAGVEQQITTNAHLENLAALQNASFAASMVGFIGTEVEAETNQLPLQDGEAEFTYDLSSNAKNVVISVTDSTGRVMFTKAGELSAGRHTVVWDGKDMNSIQQPDGAYIVTVTPLGFEDEPVAVSTRVKGRVTGVSMDSGQAVLDVGGASVALEKILSINEAKSQATGGAN